MSWSKQHGCVIERTSSEWKVVDENALTVSTFAVTHSRHTARNMVKPVYVKQFLKAIEESKNDQKAND